MSKVRFQKIDLLRPKAICQRKMEGSDTKSCEPWAVPYQLLQELSLTWTWFAFLLLNYLLVSVSPPDLHNCSQSSSKYVTFAHLKQAFDRQAQQAWAREQKGCSTTGYPDSGTYVGNFFNFFLIHTVGLTITRSNIFMWIKHKTWSAGSKHSINGTF